ncbi:hypothetical protein [Candidatus Magnetomonas plexicatena]|uniref:hypothetical protein n=1 Tax=Candidatus Magnetomonas plexicatena TaxID=2552947 RepID=UPI001C75B00A|nr:hypothetical protein E2O03_004415 [Nitrospirales bacterium LBB_01]
MAIRVDLTVLIIFAGVFVMSIAAAVYLYVKRDVSQKKLLKEMETLKESFSNELKTLRKKVLESELALDDVKRKYGGQVTLLKNKLSDTEKVTEQVGTLKDQNSVVKNQASLIKNQTSLIYDFKETVSDMIKRFHTVAELNNHLTNRHKAKAEKSEAIKAIVTDFQTGNKELEVLIEILEKEVFSLDSKLRKEQPVKSEIKKG